jgi:hypothetical protein
MPFVLHPSGYCTFYHESSKNNLVRGAPCPVCKKVAGHKPTCPNYDKDKTDTLKSSRSKLFDATSVLWYRGFNNGGINFFTFTLPSRSGERTFQISADCTQTGDLKVTEQFSKLLEGISIKQKRDGQKFSYVWVSEAQMSRQKKFGGIGDIHFHLVTDSFIPVNWCTDYWSSLVANLQPIDYAKSSVHVDSIPNSVNSIPGYLTKYMGKGAQRRILSRRFSCTRDLSSYIPIKFSTLPSGTLVRENHTLTPTGYEVSTYYYDTSEVLANYGELMQDEKKFNVTRMDKNFTPDEIAWRALKREHAQKSKEINKQLNPLFNDCPF